MRPLPPDRSELSFTDGKPPLSPLQAATEANRCLYCSDAPCIKACPTGINIPEFIRKIATGNLEGSARTIFDSNILGQSCARVCPVEVLCVGDCVYNALGVPPIQIGKLQRFATDAALARGPLPYAAGPDSGRSVGLVGGGPASLACAHRLRRFGHRVTIYEARAQLGGLNVTGIAPYKLPSADGLAEAEAVLAIGGIDVVTGVSVPTDLSWATLLDRHDALFIGVGLGPDSRLGLEGEGLRGVMGAVAFIEQMKLGQVNLRGVQTAAVVGGGNTAMDAVRELRGLGVPEVVLVYRGDEAGMSGYRHEWEGARKLGVRAAFRRQPVAFAVAEGAVTGLRLAPLGPDKRPLGVDPELLPAQLVLLAIGQGTLGHLVEGLDGVQTARGRVVADAAGRTGNPRVFVGGDCKNGGKEVVNAVAEGRDAAVAIDELLRRAGAEVA